MKKLFATRLRAKVWAVTFFLVVAAAFQGRFLPPMEKVLASASGPSPSYTNAPGETSCVACHTSFPVNSGSGSVTITGVPLNYRPGQQYSLTVTTSQADGVIYGFQMTSLDAAGRQAGTLSFPASTPQPLQIVQGLVNSVQRRYIEHTIDGVTPTQFGSKSWTFNWTAPPRRVGKIGFFAAGNAANSDGTTNGDRIYTTNQAAFSSSGIASFDGDGRSDVSVFRPSDGGWYSLNSTDGTFQALAFGQSGDKIAPGDYDGDGKTDRAVFRPSDGVWYIMQSTAGFRAVQFGTNGDVPATGDYDGDLKSDIAVYRPSTGVWYFLLSGSGFSATQFGQVGDRTAQADFDGDGKTDIAVYRPSNGGWYLLRSSLGFTGQLFGTTGDQPVQGDYDGDGKADIAVYRPSEGVWYVSASSAGFTAVRFGASTDKPAPADFDGDGKTDYAVFRPSNGGWYILRSTDGGVSTYSFGTNGDKPVAAGYLAE